MTYYYLNSPTLRATARCVPSLLVMLPLIVTAALPKESIQIGEIPAPSPELDPPEVVRIQVEALRKNSILNEGIRLAYRFASPDNKRYTGPLNRFIEMVRSPPYHWLLNHVKAHYGAVAVSGTEAYQLVTITDKGGEAVTYAWVLSLQNDGEFKDCWMTDAVIPTKPPATRQDHT